LSPFLSPSIGRGGCRILAGKAVSAEEKSRPDSKSGAGIMALSDLTVRQAKATGLAYTLGDIDGLSLNVSPHGGKSWHFRYYWAGRQKRISLGTYPEISLRQARQSRDEARALLSQGVNPRVHRRCRIPDDSIRAADVNVSLEAGER
jgi:hypothetical protein